MLDYHDEDPGRPEVVIVLAAVASFMFMAGAMSARHVVLAVAVCTVFGAACGWVVAHLPPHQPRALHVSIAAVGFLTYGLGRWLVLTYGGSAGG